MSVKKEFLNRYSNLELFDFVHIPKCAGQYFNQFFKYDSLINYLGHTKNGKGKKKNIPRHSPVNKFTIIREPVNRFISFINFSLTTGHFQKFLPIDFVLKSQDKNISFDNLIDELPDNLIKGEIQMFYNYKYWTEGSKFVFTISQFENLYKEINPLYMQILNDSNKEIRYNKSVAKWGMPNQTTLTKLNGILKDDIKYFNKISNQAF